MNSPPVQPPRTKSFVPLMLASILLSAVVATLSLLTLGFAGVIVAIVLLLASFVGSQYLLWGWWLGRIIREREAKAEALKRGDMAQPTSISHRTLDE